MCGIAGFYGFRDDSLIRKISKQLIHRGPDGEGLFADEKVTLLNRRLAIIDVKGGNQPIFNEDDSLAIVFVGEIYNYLELKDFLLKEGHKFKTLSDTEVILHGYEHEGTSFFNKLNGMFAIAIYDRNKKKLILARDHFGIKPLYFSQTKKGLIFSSELKPIFYSGLVEKKPNDRVIYRYLKYRVHDNQKETFFENIFRLLPGEVMEISEHGSKIKKYSNLEKELLALSSQHSIDRSPDRLGQEKIVKTFQKELIKAIKYRLISEVPVGTCLSGGLDSSTIVSVVNMLLKDKVKEASSIGKIQKTFSAVFPGLNNDEEKYIDLLTKQLTNSRINVFKVKPNSKEFFKEIQNFVRIQEEPTISTGPYAQYKVMEKAHKKVTVLLDGQGSDEMMAGYLPYYFVYMKQLFLKKNYLLLIREFLSSLDVVVKYLLEKFKKKINIDSLLAEKFVNKHKNQKFTVERNNLKKRLIEDIFENSLQSLLRYEDRNSMHFSIEGRVPFLDFNLLKYLFSLPDKMIIKNGWNKYILRQATDKLLPKKINKRRNKIGFTTPEYHWFKAGKKEIFEIFLSESFSNRKYFDRKKILEAWQDFIDGKTDDTMVFWRLINVELWLREFFDLNTKAEQDLFLQKKIQTKIKIDGKVYKRYLIKTDLFKKGDDYPKKIAHYVNAMVDSSTFLRFSKSKKNLKWFVVVSEKIISISQGRSYFLWDIHPGFWARILSKYVTKSPYGIGLGSPWTMELAIREIGIIRIIIAAVVSALTKPFGIKGLFYRLVGETVRSIDGPTEYSLFPSNVSAKLGPKNPQQTSENLKSQILNLKSTSKIPKIFNGFLGAVIIDANDIGRNVLGNSTGLSDKLIEDIMKDNPMGQSNEMTPITIVIIKS